MFQKHERCCGVTIKSLCTEYRGILCNTNIKGNTQAKMSFHTELLQFDLKDMVLTTVMYCSNRNDNRALQSEN